MPDGIEDAEADWRSALRPGGSARADASRAQVDERRWVFPIFDAPGAVLVVPLLVYRLAAGGHL